MKGRTLLADVPRLGWIDVAPPVTPLDDLAARLGLAWLGVKRDDLLAALRGGSKPRKLDYLLAEPAWRRAWGWQSMGAIGSGHLVACTAAAVRLGRNLVAHCFWEPPSTTVLDNLAFTSSGPVTVRFYRSRTALGLHRPGLLLRPDREDLPVIPPGATCAAGMVGLVRAGLELAEQIEGGVVPVPDRIYVALGTGGTVAGLSVGLGLAGIPTTVHAVASVERLFATRRSLRRHTRQLLAHLAAHGLPPVEPVRVVLDHRQVGDGYGRPTGAGLDALARFAALGVPLEAIYTGKAAAALVADAEAGIGGRALLWNTAHAGPLPHDVDWTTHLPAALAERLERERALPPPAA